MDGWDAGGIPSGPYTLFDNESLPQNAWPAQPASSTTGIVPASEWSALLDFDMAHYPFDATLPSGSAPPEYSNNPIMYPPSNPPMFNNDPWSTRAPHSEPVVDFRAREGV
jgi:hypothetical protein